MNKLSFLSLIVLVALCFFAGCAGESDTDSSKQADLAPDGNEIRALNNADNAKDDPEEPVPTADAYERPGDAGDGRWILPNGRFISPVGQRVTTNRFPMSMALHPEGDYLYVATAKTAALDVINLQTMTLEQEVALPKHFGGMAISSDGTLLWVAGGSREKIYEYIIAGGIPSLNREIPAFGYPTDLKVSADEQYFYASMAFGKNISVIDIGTGEVVRILNTGIYPYDVALAEGIDRVISSNWGTWTISVFKMSDGTLLGDIDVGKNPEGIVIAPDGQTAYVACSDTDDVYEVDIPNLTVTRSIPLHEDLDAVGYGAMATELALSDDGKTLYVTASGFNSIDVIDIDAWEVKGRIPTEWYPTKVMPVDDTLYVLSGKGTGAGPGQVKKGGRDLPAAGGQLLGSVEAILLPDGEILSEYTAMVEENNTRTSRFYDTEVQYDSPIPSQRGVPSDKIKHVVFILKENKTFDQVLSDMPGVEGDNSLLIFGDFYTPNLHALAGEFAFSDNYYSESHESDMGHSWATGVMANDYVEKNWVANDWFMLTGVESASIPAGKTVFHKLLESNISFRVYGEVVGTMGDVEKFAPYVNFNYGFYTYAVSDRRRAEECIREWEAGIFPQFIFILLPNDHTEGTTPGAPTMQYHVADNDAGMGMLVDWIAHSQYWPETAIFITQDDPQSGVDHIDAHRTPLTVISPYAKRGHISNVHHSMASLWLTFELILGMGPMTNYDRFTAPLYDFFQPQQDLTVDFTAIPSNVPWELNPENLAFADYCKAQNWAVPDRVERIGEVVWAYMKPGVPYPFEYAVAPSEKDEEEAEEEEEGEDYEKMMKAYLDYGRKNNLFHPEHSLVGKNLIRYGDDDKK